MTLEVSTIQQNRYNKQLERSLTSKCITILQPRMLHCSTLSNLTSWYQYASMNTVIKITIVRLVSCYRHLMKLFARTVLIFKKCIYLLSLLKELQSAIVMLFTCKTILCKKIFQSHYLCYTCINQVAKH